MPTINEILSASGDSEGIKRKMEDLPEEIQRFVQKGKYLMREWWDAYFPLAEANSDWNFGRKNPNNNNFKKRSLRIKMGKARDAIEAAGFQPRSRDGSPKCIIKTFENTTELFPEYTVIIIGQFNADFGNWDDEGNFQKTFSVNF